MNRNAKLLSVTTGLLCGFVGCLVSSVASADPPEHPHYLHALADLRTARAWITMPVQDKVTGKEAEVVANIDKAIAEIKRASIDDGKDIKDHDTIDVEATKHEGRLHKAWDLLKSANKDLHMKEGNSKSWHWKEAATGDVEFAMRYTGQAIKEAKEKP